MKLPDGVTKGFLAECSETTSGPHLLCVMLQSETLVRRKEAMPYRFEFRIPVLVDHERWLISQLLILHLKLPRG